MRKIVLILMFVTVVANTQWVQVNNGLTQRNVNALISNGNTLFAGTIYAFSVGGLYVSTNNGDSWVLSLQISDVFSFASSGIYTYAGLADAFYYTSNNGTNWINVPLPNGSHWYYSAAAINNFVFLGCKWWSNDPGGIYRSTNYGANWTQTSFTTQNYEDVKAMITAGNYLFATTNFRTYRSSDNGDTWQISANFGAKAMTSIGNNIFAGTDGTPYGVFLSTDNGISWNQTSLNNVGIWAITGYDNNVFAGGVYVSTNNGLTWTQRADGMPYFVRTLHVYNGYLYAGTDGNGVFRRPLSELVGINPISTEIPNQFSLSQNYPNPFNLATIIKFQIQKLSNTKLVIYDIMGREVETLVNEQLNAGTYETEWSATGGADKFSSGVYYYKLTAGDYTETKKMVLIK